MDVPAAKEDHPDETSTAYKGSSSVDQEETGSERGIVIQKHEMTSEGTSPEKTEVRIQSNSSATDVPHEPIPEEPIFDGTEKASGLVGESERSSANETSQSHEKGRLSALEFARKGVDWPEKAAAFRTFVKERGEVMSNVLRRLSDKMDDLVFPSDKDADTSADGPQRAVSSDLQNWEHIDAGETVQSTKYKGRITLFSKSGCQDSRAVRSLLRSKGVCFVEVNVDIFPQRKMELEERTGTASVPQVFFNDEFVGGFEELNAWEVKKELDEKLKNALDTECPATAPQPIVYGEDEQENIKLDAFAEVVRKLKEKIQVKDHFYKMRYFTRCFTASEALEVFTEDQYCEKEEAVEFGRQVAAKHFFHHVLQENLFEDGNHFYRFLEHDPIISTKCFNFSGSINDSEPLAATEIEANLRKFTLAIIDSYVSDDGKRVDYRSISMSEEFRRYIKMAESLHRFNVSTFSREEKLAFFINLYNIMTIHAILVLGHPNGPLDRRRLFGDFQYLVGGYPYSLSAIQNGVLRGNQRPPYQLIKPFGPKDRRLPVALGEPECLIHFALTCASRSSPALKCYSPKDIDAELRAAVRAFFLDGGVVIDMESKTISLSKIIKWFSVDFGKNELEILRWIVNHLEPSKAENLLELLDGNQFKVVYQQYDWSPNL
ncbi:hypothetical protein KP509_23G010000 [Ceratopteris richardii]|uniref:DEP domain-containing protein n=1 Tax=Ceratopteris richardii TaxID=49495 RepID=A0A8T2RXD3_CERRI|nr:hypothetical protein KP509_23G010000 [Ceratopteris richardii]